MSEIRFNRWSHQSGTGGIYQDSSGNIGIGTSIPTSVLDIQGGSIKIGNDLLTSSGVSTFTSGLNVTGGSVGIGTDNPATPLHLFGTSDILLKVESTDQYAHIELGDNSSTARITNDGATGTLRLRADKGNVVSSSNIQFEIDGSEKVRIDSSGNVGIGTDNPYSNASFNSLSVGGSGKYGLIELVKSNGVAGSWIDSYGTSGDGNLRFTTAGTSGAITFWTGGEFTEKVRITSSGNVGIGSTIPQSSLDVAGEVRASGIAITTSYPTILPSLNLNFARSRSLDPRITFTRASTATYVGRDGLIKTAGEDEARFDHDPETLESLGLLIEDSRTNAFLYSDLSTVDTTSNATTSRTTGLDGNSTSALDVTYTAASGAYILSYSSPISASTEYTFSVWIKKVSGSTSGSVYSYVTGGTDGVLSGQIYNTDGQHLGQAPTGVWKRYSKTFTTSAGSTAIRVTMPGYDSNGLNIHYFGAQIEAGSFPTSYIPTSGAAVTRAKDDALISGGSFESWINKEEGTWFIEYKLVGTLTALMAISNTGGSVNERYMMWNLGVADSISNAVVDGGVVQANLSQSITSSLTQFTKAIFAGKDNDFALSANGQTPVTDTSGTIYNSPTQLRFAYGNGQSTPNAHFKSCIYYPKRLTNAQLQQLTS